MFVLVDKIGERFVVCSLTEGKRVLNLFGLKR